MSFDDEIRKISEEETIIDLGGIPPGELIAVQEAIWNHIRYLKHFEILSPAQQLVLSKLHSFLRRIPDY